MSFRSLAPCSPSTDSASSSPSQPFPHLSTHLSASTSAAVPLEGSIRKRVVRACEVCRRKKVKCNGQKPCSQCIAFAEECIYVDVKDRSAYSRRYVESLESRLAEVEKTLVVMSKIKTCSGTCQTREGRGGMRRASDPGAGTSTRLEFLHHQRRPAAVPEVHSLGERADTALSAGLSADLSFLSAPFLIAEASAALHSRNQHIHPASTSSSPTKQMPPYQTSPTASQLSFELDLEFANEVDSNSTFQPLPAQSNFHALLESFAVRIYPFCPIILPSEVHLAWQQVSPLPLSPATSNPTAVSLVFAIVSCGSQALGSETGPQTRRQSQDSSIKFFAQAKLWAELMGKHEQGGVDVLRQIQVHALLAHFSAGRGDAWLAFEHNVRARILLKDFAFQAGEQKAVHKRVSKSILLLDHLIRCLMRRPDPQKQDLFLQQPEMSKCPNDVHVSDFFTHLSRLSNICTVSGSVGGTLFDLLHPPPNVDAAEKIKARARHQDTLLQEWYSGLPVAFRTFPSQDSDPTSAIGSCMVFVSLQFERVRLHIALQQLASRTRSSASGEFERSDQTRCEQVATQAIQMAPTILRYLPQGPWLALYAHCVGVSAAVLALITVERVGDQTTGLLTEVEAAGAVLKKLELVQGITDTRVKLERLSEEIKTQMGEAGRLGGGMKRERADKDQGPCISSSEREVVLRKRFRAAPVSQRGPKGDVSPFFRPESDSSLPPAQPPTTPLPNASEASHILGLGFPHHAITHVAPLPWQTTNGNGTCGNNSTGLGTANFFHDSTSIFPFPPLPARQQHHPQQQQQQQHHQNHPSDPNATFSNRTTSLEPNQEAMIAGLLRQFMEQQDAHCQV